MKLKELMTERNVAQYEMANILNVSRSSIYKYQEGKAEPNIETLIKIADYFNVSMDYLCGRQNSNVIFVDSLTEEQKKIVSLVRGLTHDQSLLVLGYLSNMLKLPYEDVRPVRPQF